MKKLIGVVLACAVLIIGLKPAQAETASISFDIMGSFYTPADSRFSGMGTGFGINININKNLTMAYRVEEMIVRAEGQAVGGPIVAYNRIMRFHGIAAHYRTVTLQDGKVGVDFGMWMGSAASAVQSGLFVEPMGRITYTTTGKVKKHVVMGIGYRFVPEFTVAAPFGVPSRNLKNFNGLDLLFGLGIGF